MSFKFAFHLLARPSPQVCFVLFLVSILLTAVPATMVLIYNWCQPGTWQEGQDGVRSWFFVWSVEIALSYPVRLAFHLLFLLPVFSYILLVLLYFCIVRTW